MATVLADTSSTDFYSQTFPMNTIKLTVSRDLESVSLASWMASFVDWMPLSPSSLPKKPTATLPLKTRHKQMLFITPNAFSKEWNYNDTVNTQPSWHKMPRQDNSIMWREFKSLETVPVGTAADKSTSQMNSQNWSFFNINLHSTIPYNYMSKLFFCERSLKVTKRYLHSKDNEKS